MVVELLAIACALAGSPDTAHVWARQAFGVSGFPTGLISDTRVQVRTPLHRSDAIVFRDTYAGAGMRVAATPAFTSVGPRLSISPIDVFELDLAASWIGFYGPGGIGLLPFDTPQDKLGSDREARADEGVPGGGLQLSAAPTLRAKVGPVIAAGGWTFAWSRLVPGQDHASRFVFDPATSLVTGWEDVTIEQQGALLLEVLPDEGAAFLWVGASVRDRRALASAAPPPATSSVAGPGRAPGPRSCTRGSSGCGTPTASEWRRTWPCWRSGSWRAR